MFGAAYAAPNKSTTILYWIDVLSTVLSPTEQKQNSSIFQGFWVIFEYFSKQI